MIRKVIVIDEEKCDGCGICISACDEGALALVDGKAKLIRDDYCDGFGNCLPACPVGAITFIEREAAAYDEEAVKKHIAEQKAAKTQFHAAPTNEHECGCPGSKAAVFAKKEVKAAANNTKIESQLRQWPVQIKLVSAVASFFNGADLLIAADCCAYAYGNFHNDFMRDKVTVIGCPKLDMIDYTQKLTSIIANNNIKSVTVVRMEVPCCSGIEYAAAEALKNSGKKLPYVSINLSLEGEVL